MPPLNALMTTKALILSVIWMLLLPAFAHGQETTRTFLEAAHARTQKEETYDGSYRVIAYPNGDVADNLGVCTDLIIRAYRAINIDLQVLVHKDMQEHFKEYPQRWQLKKADSNIDHRRVPNLQHYFKRQGASLTISTTPTDYRPGDLVTWNLPGNLPHIGIVSDNFVPGTNRPKIIHNIGAGPAEEDSLFAFPITGHYRFKLPTGSPQG